MTKNAERIRRNRARWRAIGCCVRCGVPAQMNKRTGRHFLHCLEHRIIVSAYTQKYLAKRRNQQEAA